MSVSRHTSSNTISAQDEAASRTIRKHRNREHDREQFVCADNPVLGYLTSSFACNLDGFITWRVSVSTGSATSEFVGVPAAVLRIVSGDATPVFACAGIPRSLWIAGGPEPSDDTDAAGSAVARGHHA